MTGPGVVEMRPDGTGGFAVVCVPPDPAHPPQSFADRRDAWGRCGGIKLVTGRRKVDLTGGDDGKER